MKHDFPQRLKKARLEAGLTQSELNKLCGYECNWVTNFEQGNRKPGCDSLIKLATGLKCSVDYLLGA